MEERLGQSAREAATEAMMLKGRLEANSNQLPLFATAGCPAPSKEMPLNDKSLIIIFGVKTPKL